MKIWPKDVQRFWKYIEKQGDCWIWVGAKNGKNGKYGRMNIGGRMHGPHIISYIMANGEVPYGKMLSWTCENKVCCNPEHLILMDRGWKLTKKKLLEIIEMKKSGMLQKHIASQMGISQGRISRILRDNNDRYRNLGQCQKEVEIHGHRTPNQYNE